MSLPSHSALLQKGYPPGPTRAVAKSLNLRDIHTYAKLHEEYGDIFMLPLGEIPLVVTRSPDHIRSLLGGSATRDFPRPANVLENISILFGRAQIALDGEPHEENKRMLSKWLFSTRENAKMMDSFHGVCDAFLERCAEDCANGKCEAYGISELASADISGLISMGRSYNALKTGTCPQLEALKVADRIFLGRAMNKSWRTKESPDTSKTFEASVKLIADTFSHAMDDMRMNPVSARGHNILEHMIKENARNRTATCPMGRAPTESEAVSNMVGFLAGVGNSARLISIGIEMLVVHPEYQKRILEEIHRVMSAEGDGGIEDDLRAGRSPPGTHDIAAFTYDRIMKMEYLKCFMSECLRMYPPSTSVAPRETSKRSSLGEYSIPPNTKVMCNIHACHRHPDHWQNPEVFDPLRFNESEQDGECRLKSFAPEGFFPFGYGGHGCIGKNLAQLATLTLWAALVSRYEVERAPGADSAVFNTTNSIQIFGFIEALNGVNVRIKPRPQSERALAHDAPSTEERAVANIRNRIITTEKRIITPEELAKHATEESGVWMAIDGIVYDVTTWLVDHPGGKAVLLRSGGKDATRAFNLVRHSDFAVAEAERYAIGVLKQTSNL